MFRFVIVGGTHLRSRLCLGNSGNMLFWEPGSVTGNQSMDIQ